jgi:ABC-2 type transport system permease protein
MIQSVSRLLQLRIRVWWNTQKAGASARKIGYLVALAGTLVLLVGLVLISIAFFRFLTSTEVLRTLQRAGIPIDLGGLIAQVPVLLMIGAFGLGLFANVGALLQGLYLSHDMEFLLAAPISARAVFISKLIQAITPVLLFLFLLIGPALLGLGFSQNYSFPYYLLFPIFLILLVLTGAGISSLVVMGVVRVLEPRRAAELLGLVGGLSVLVCSQSGQFSQQVDLGTLPTDQIGQLGGFLQLLDSDTNPLAWPGRALVAVGEGEWAAGFLFSILTVGLTLLVFRATLQVSEKLYFSGWARVQVGTRARKKKRSDAARPAGRVSNLLVLAQVIPVQVRAVVLKDLRLYRRDIRNLSQLIFPIILAVMWFFSMAREDPEEIGRLQPLAQMGSLWISLFLGYTFAVRFGLSSFSMEGRQWWILQSAPIPQKYLLLSKFLIAFLLPLLLAFFYLSAASLLRQVTLLAYLYQVFSVVIVMAALAGLLMAFGIWGARFDWENPNEIQGGSMGCLASVVGMGFLGLAGLVLGGPPLLVDYFNWPPWAGLGLGFVSGAVLCTAVGVLPLWFAVRKLPTLGME